MPKDLAALLVDEGAASAEAVARALDRQREEGGALDTALLEEGVLQEAELVGWLARAAELPAAPPSAWEAADARARRVFPSRVAERHGLAPFALDGRALSLVATFPVDVALLDEISFMLSLDLAAHVGPEWRVRELIHRLYGTPLAPRLAALAAAAGARVEAVPAGPAGPAAPAGQAAAARPQATPTGFARDDAEPLEPLAAALQQAIEAADPGLFDDEAPHGGAPGEPEASSDAQDPEPPRPPQDRTAPPHWTLGDARAALAAARHRDDVVLAAIRYARDFFEYAAVFAVTRDAIAGHDAIGAEDERDRARSIAIWASDPGVFKTVLETRAPHLGPVSHEAAGNEAILSGLGRGTPHTVLAYPVLLRDRPICVVYADNGEAPVSPRRLADLLLFLSGMGAAFERIIRDRKDRGRRRPAARPAPAAEPPPTALAEPVASAAAAAPASAPPVPEAAALAAPAGGDADIPVDLPPFEFESPERPAQAGPREAPPAAAAPDAAAPGPDRVPAPDASETESALASADVDLGDLDGREGEASPPPSPAAVAFDDIEEAFFSSAPGSAPIASAEAPRVAAAATPTSTSTATPAHPDAPAPEPLTPVALADRALDGDPSAAAAACEDLAQRRRDPAIRAAAEKLRRALLSGLSARATRAAHALGAVRDAEAIPLLIQVLETSEPGTARASADALAAITLQRLGPDARRWLDWWKQNRGRGRAEWLFSGLTSADRDTRVAAAVELSHAAPPPVAYSADLPPEERERAARAWAGWWARSGQVL